MSTHTDRSPQPGEVPGDWVRRLLKSPSDRDKQRRVGPSDIGDPCSRCLAGKLAGESSPQGRYWLGARIGSAIHLALEELTTDVPGVVPETKVTVGELEGYGVIRGSADSLWLDERHLIDFKGLPLDTPLPTPTGWTTMGEVQVGDTLFGSDGKPARVTGKSEVHHNPCYRIVFDDTSEVICDADHRWKVTVGQASSSRVEVMSVREIIKRGLSTSGQHDVRVLNAGALELPDVDLPIDPYVLGAWLGDGETDGGRITKPLKAMWDEIISRGYSVSHDHAANNGRAETRTVYGLRASLKSLGVLGNKHIPVEYLRASYSQRLDLLRGLMDTDGYYNPARKSVVMTTTSQVQAQYTHDLVVTMGWKASVMPFVAKWQGGTKQAWMVSYIPLNGEQVFLARQPENYVLSSGRSGRRVIKSIESIETVPTQCIQVDSYDQTYLCTREMIPTHNTTMRDKLTWIKLALQTEPGELEMGKLVSTRHKVAGYIAQTHLYAKGLGNVDKITLVFICRDGSTDSDIWSYTMDYDPQYAEKVWGRLQAIWKALQDGREPDTFASHSECFPCNNTR